ncbi:MAG: leucine-rich repeat domain-containing protein [Clostridiales bacterium]|nr:MAG: leucine-rich repeat domain-containing protein [Clostridiales bacterium]
MVQKAVEYVYFNETAITDFGANVFNGQQYLQTVTLPSTAESLGINAFRGCERLKSVNIPEKITTIGAGAFFNTSRVNQLTVTFEGNSALNFTSGEKTAFGYNSQNYIIKVCSTVPKNFD